MTGEVQHLRLITLLMTSGDDEFKCSEVQPVQIWNKPCFNSGSLLGKRWRVIGQENQDD